MGKRLAAVGMAAVIAGGGLTVAAVNPLGVAGASSAGTTQEQPTTPTTTTKHRVHRKGPLQRALDKLVADKTITKEQADAVLSTTRAEAKAARQHRQHNRQELLQVVADAIGSTPDEVKAGLKDGTSIAEQAKAKGVDRQVVDDAITKALTARIDAAVKAGKITEQQGEKAKSHLDKAVDRILDADGHRLGHRRGGLRRGGN